MAHRFVLTGFADEIAPDLETQVDALAELDIRYLDLRSVNGMNVLDLTPPELRRVHDVCAEKGIRIQSIGSPVNKIPYDVMNQGAEFDKLRKAIKAAQHVNVKRVRIFSPEVPPESHDEYGSRVINWLSEQRRLADDFGVTLLHENDGHYWGAYPKNAKRLFESLGSASFRACFDFANSTLIGFDPLNDWLPWLLPYLDTIHVKDAVKSEGRVVPAGEGDSRIVESLKYLVAQDWSGPLTLEPHLDSAGKFGGFSGAKLFGVAAEALRRAISEAGG